MSTQLERADALSGRMPAEGFGAGLPGQMLVLEVGWLFFHYFLRSAPSLEVLHHTLVPPSMPLLKPWVTILLCVFIGCPLLLTR